MGWRRPGRHRTMTLAAAVSAAAAVSVAVLAAGCGQSRPAAGGGEQGGEQVLVGRAERLSPASMSPGQVTAAEDAFSLALFGRVCSSKPGPNLLLSPESAAEALGMLYAGARGPTAASVGRLLRLPAWNPGLVAALDRHTAVLAGLHQLTVSNDLFEQSGDRPAPRVLDDLRTAYHAGVGTADFGDEPATTNRINAVVARETHGLVPALFQAPLPTSTRVVLTNALYLKAPWLNPFPAASPAPFRTAGGQVVSVPLMSSTAPVASYRRAGGWQSATLPYAGGRLAAVALLPPVGAAACAVPGLAQWTALTAGTSAQSAAVRLPRLHLTQTWDQPAIPPGRHGPASQRRLHRAWPRGQPDLRSCPARHHGRHPCRDHRRRGDRRGGGHRRARRPPPDPDLQPAVPAAARGHHHAHPLVPRPGQRPGPAVSAQQAGRSYQIDGVTERLSPGGRRPRRL